MIFKIREQKKKKILKILSFKKMMKRMQRAEKVKNDVLTTRRFSSDDVEMITKTKKIRNRVIINESLTKNIAFSAYIVRRTFEMLAHDVRVIDVNTINQQKIIRRIEKQNEKLHSKLKIVKMI